MVASTRRTIAGRARWAVALLLPCVIPSTTAMAATITTLPVQDRSATAAAPAEGADAPNSDALWAEALQANEKCCALAEEGQHREALPYAERVVELVRQVKGEEGFGFASALTSLAILHRAMGAHDKALPLYERALAIREKHVGPDHPDVATIVTDLALVHQEMGAYDKALPLCERALAISEKHLGRDHPAVAATLSNLAGLHAQAGAYGKALRKAHPEPYFWAPFVYIGDPR